MELRVSYDDVKVAWLLPFFNVQAIMKAYKVQEKNAKIFMVNQNIYGETQGNFLFLKGNLWHYDWYFNLLYAQMEF